MIWSVFDWVTRAERYLVTSRRNSGRCETLFAALRPIYQNWNLVSAMAFHTIPKYLVQNLHFRPRIPSSQCILSRAAQNVQWEKLNLGKPSHIPNFWTVAVIMIFWANVVFLLHLEGLWRVAWPPCTLDCRNIVSLLWWLYVCTQCMYVYGY